MGAFGVTGRFRQRADVIDNAMKFKSGGKLVDSKNS